MKNAIVILLIVIVISIVTVLLTKNKSNLAGSFSSQVSNLATSTCVWNGSNFTKIYFASNSVTPVYATSTGCI
jgi:preprotein translocase subunit SecG